MTITIPDMPAVSKVLANPVVRSVVTNSAGIIAAAIDQAIQSPNATAQAYLTIHPQAALAYILVQDISHNLIGSFLAKVNAQASVPVVQTAPKA